MSVKPLIQLLSLAYAITNLHFSLFCVLLYASIMLRESILEKICWRKKAFIMRRGQRTSNAVQKNGAWGLLVMLRLEQEVEPDWKT